MCKANCGCSKAHHLKAHLSRDEIKRASLDGREYVVVPVIMARGDVVMNDLLTPASEFETFAWNGVPVTLRHPTDEGGAFLSANEPAQIEKFAIGRIFNTQIVDGQLRAEAWIDIEKATALAPDLIDTLEAGGPMDVSTGFYSTTTPAKGVVNGRAYKGVNSNIRPDHLALLPDQQGACSWDDGCGVRANAAKIGAKVHQAWAVIAEHLGLQSALVANSEKDAAKKEEGQSDPAAADEEKVTAMTNEEIAALAAEVAKTASANAVAEALKAQSASIAAIVAEALKAHTAAQAEVRRPALTERITANSSMTKEQLAAMPVETLEVIANGLPKPAESQPGVDPFASYGGQAFPASIHANAADDDLVKAVAPVDLLAHFKKKAA